MSSETFFVQSVMQKWKEVSNILNITMQHYLDACFTVQSALSGGSANKGDTLVLEILNDMDLELARLVSYRSKLCQAQTALSTTRNQSPTLVPINILPLELLSRIFIILVLAESYGASASRHHAIFQRPKYPCLLSEVCRSWRQVISSTPALWSHIDLVIQEPHTGWFYNRASYFLKRVANAPLAISVCNVQLTDPGDAAAQRLAKWLAPIAKQVHSLDLETEHNEFLYPALGCWLKHGLPGTVKQLSLWSWDLNDNPVMESASSSSTARWQFDVAAQRFEDFFQPLTLLRLGGMRPPWYSQAYRGLLHLSMSQGSIPQAQLVCILSENPQLRTLSFGMQVTHIESHGLSYMPVSLPRLELLGFGVADTIEISLVLRLIASGSRPLKLAIALNAHSDLYGFTEAKDVKQFLQRSNVDTFYLNGSSSFQGGMDYMQLRLAIEKFPNLRKLGLDSCKLVQKTSLPESGQDVLKYLELDELCLMNCSFRLERPHQFLQLHSVKVLRLLDCTTTLPSGIGGNVGEKEVHDLAPDVKCYKYQSDVHLPDPHLNWEFTSF